MIKKNDGKKKRLKENLGGERKVKGELSSR